MQILRNTDFGTTQLNEQSSTVKLSPGNIITQSNSPEQEDVRPHSESDPTVVNASQLLVSTSK